MRKIVIIAMCFAFLLSGCAWKYRALNTTAEWTNKNFDKFEELYPKADEGEQAWMRANIAPYLNILKHAVIALGAIEEDNDVELAHEIHKIVKIATNVNLSVHGLEYGLKSKDRKIIKRELVDLKNFTQMRMGIVKK